MTDVRLFSEYVMVVAAAASYCPALVALSVMVKVMAAMMAFSVYG